jgi:hypothetical protein
MLKTQPKGCRADHLESLAPTLTFIDHPSPALPPAGLAYALTGRLLRVPKSDLIPDRAVELGAG